MFKKEASYFIFLLILILFAENVYALGVSPAIKEFNFEPGLEKILSYNVLEDNPNMELELYTSGDLAQYVSLDKESLVGRSSFTATLKLPDSIEKPGTHIILIGVKQKIDPELIKGNIGTAIIIQVPIYIYVPFPGRYIELDLRGHDVNVGEPVNFELDVISKGTESFNINPIIEIYSGSQKIKSLNFQNRLLQSQQVLGLQKQMDTTGLNPGNYKATASVDYGIIVKDEVDFRIGSLNIDITNYSNFIPIGKLQPFNIEIQSGWNNNIDGVFADVQILNNSQILSSFKTTSTSLTAWEKKIITGYVDTSNFQKGTYDANITLTYYGTDERGSTGKIVKVEFYEKPSMLIWFIIGGTGILIILVFGAIMLIKKIRSIKNGTFKRSHKK
jgi:hypothetical protein